MDIVKLIKNSVAPYFGEEKKSFEYIKKKVKWSEMFLFVVILSVLSYFLENLVNSEEKILIPNYMLYIGVFVGTPMLLFLGYGLNHLFLKLFGGKAIFEDTLKFGNSVSIFPLFITTLLGLIPLSLIDTNTTFGNAFEILVYFMIIGVGIWSIVVTIRMYSKLHKISMFRVFMAMILPMFIIMFLVFIAIIIFALSIAGSGSF